MIKKYLFECGIILFCVITPGCGKDTGVEGVAKALTPTTFAVASASSTVVPVKESEPSVTAAVEDGDDGSDGVLLQQVCTIYMKDNETGWALSWDGGLLATNDAWKSHKQTYRFKGYGNDACCPSISYRDNTLIVIGYSAKNDNEVDIYQSKNEGRSWSISHLKNPDLALCSSGTIYSCFMNNKEGYLLCCGDPAAGQMLKFLFKTRDGGKSYQEVADVSLLCGYPTGMCFSKSGRGFITCTYHGNDSAHLYRSLDQGKTWKDFKVNPPKSTSYAYVNSYLPYFNGQEGYMLFAYVDHGKDYPQYIMVHSANGGKTWNAEGNVALKASQIMSASFGDDKTIYIIDDSGNLMKKVKIKHEWK